MPDGQTSEKFVVVTMTSRRTRSPNGFFLIKVVQIFEFCNVRTCTRMYAILSAATVPSIIALSEVQLLHEGSHKL